MAHRWRSAPRTPLASATLIVALVVAACADQAPPPAPASLAPPASTSSAPVSPPAAPESTQPAATPTPSAVAAAAAFVATVSAPDFAAHVAIAGTSTLGPATTTLSGTMDIDGAESQVVLTRKRGRASTTARTIVTDGSRYVMTTPAGLWFAAPEPGGGALAGSLDVSPSDVIDTGVVSKDGQDLHHLVITPPLTLADVLGVDGTNATVASTSMEAWVEADGTPVVVELGATWSQPVKGKPLSASIALSLTFSPLPAGTTIAAPDPVWQWNTSARFRYRMAYPVGWTFRAGSAKLADAYDGTDSNAVFASRGSNRGVTLRDLSRALSRYLPTITSISKPKILRNSGARLGPLPARRIEFTWVAAKVRYWSILYVAVKGKAYYVVEYETRRKTTAADRTLAAQFAKSFTPR